MDNSTSEGDQMTDKGEISDPTPDDTIQETDSPDAQETDTEPDTFPRKYVEELRQENARYRNEAKTAEDLAHRLHTELVRATGKLADPTDLPFDDTHLADPENLVSAIDEILDAKPHLAARKFTGDIGQGITGGGGSVNLLDLMRGTT